jgi:nickel-dependent lactate racemase
MRKIGQTVVMIWKSWYGNEKLLLEFPATWEVQVSAMRGAPPLSDTRIAERLANPVGCPRLFELARGRCNACIAIDDLTRPTEAYRIVPLLLDELNAAGISDRDVCLLVGLGSHRPLTRLDLLKKVGELVLRRVRVYNHNPHLNLKYIGDTSWGTPLHINRLFAEANLKITVGTLAPHPLAGFGGGAKMVLPGLTGIETIVRNHKAANAALTGRIDVLEGNTRRAEMEESAKMVELDFIVATVNGARGETVGLFAGYPERAFQQGARCAQHVYATAIEYGADIGVFNAFPKDTELLQAMIALNVWSTRDDEHAIVRKGGAIVLVSACTEGRGFHQVGDVGMPLYAPLDRQGFFADFFHDRDFYFFSPYVTQADVADRYPDKVILFNSWEPLARCLRKTFGSHCRVVVFPSSSYQLDAKTLKR